jgi:hypothetical protein
MLYDLMQAAQDAGRLAGARSAVSTNGNISGSLNKHSSQSTPTYTMSRWTCLLALLACAVVAAHAAGKPTAFTLADLGTATGMAANCSEPTGGSGMPAYWIEMTDVSGNVIGANRHCKPDS